MKVESDSGRIIIFYRDGRNSGEVVANKFVSLDSNFSLEEFSNEIISIEKKLLNLGYKYIYSDPPTNNPYLVLFLMNSKNNSRIFANNIEILRDTEAFNKYKKFIEKVCITKELNCGRVTLDKTLIVPVYFSFSLLEEAPAPHRYMEYDQSGNVFNITDIKPDHKNYKLTTKYFKEDLLIKRIIIRDSNTIEERKIDVNTINS